MSDQDAINLSWRGVAAGLTVFAYVAGSSGFIYQTDARASQALSEAREVKISVSRMVESIDAKLCDLESRLRSSEQQGARTEEVLRSINNQLVLMRDDFKRIR